MLAGLDLSNFSILSLARTAFEDFSTLDTKLVLLKYAMHHVTAFSPSTDAALEISEFTTQGS